uniref:Uncharacterized protein n=1 Tax=Ananas comosus var. bracteatus TaxID=296719 RepID=A0A6V7PS60_ANACO|nr:unnamed protein product [Ananas comosus var. bracteatus]
MQLLMTTLQGGAAASCRPTAGRLLWIATGHRSSRFEVRGVPGPRQFEMSGTPGIFSKVVSGPTLGGPWGGQAFMLTVGLLGTIRALSFFCSSDLFRRVDLAELLAHGPIILNRNGSGASLCLLDVEAHPVVYNSDLKPVLEDKGADMTDSQSTQTLEPAVGGLTTSAAIERIDIAEELGDIAHDLELRRGELKDNLRKVLSDEAALWRTQAKQHWLREGDVGLSFGAQFNDMTVGLSFGTQFNDMTVGLSFGTQFDDMMVNLSFGAQFDDMAVGLNFGAQFNDMAVGLSFGAQFTDMAVRCSV